MLSLDNNTCLAAPVLVQQLCCSALPVRLCPRAQMCSRPRRCQVFCQPDLPCADVPCRSRALLICPACRELPPAAWFTLVLPPTLGGVAVGVLTSLAGGFDSKGHDDVGSNPAPPLLNKVQDELAQFRRVITGRVGQCHVERPDQMHGWTEALDRLCVGLHAPAFAVRLHCAEVALPFVMLLAS